MRSFLIFLLCLICIVFVAVLNVAGTSVGNFFDNGDNPTIWTLKLYIFQVRVPNIPGIYSNSTAYLYLNNACFKPDFLDSKEEPGPACQSPRAAQTYIIRSNPHIAYDDPQAICDPVPYNATAPSGPIYWPDLACNVNPATDTGPQYAVSTAAGWMFGVFGAISSCLTILLCLPFITRHMPAYAALTSTACSAVFFLCSAAVVTADARGAVAWVNAQHSEEVNEARLGAAFQTLVWLCFVFAAGELGVVGWGRRGEATIVQGRTGREELGRRADVSDGFARELQQLADDHYVSGFRTFINLKEP